MADEQAVDEQDKDAQTGSEDSTIGRAKSRVKNLFGSDEDAKEGSEGEQQASAEADSGDAEAESSDEESASGQEQGSGEEDGSGGEEGSEDQEGTEDQQTSVSTDEVELDTIAEDEDTARAQIDKMEEEGPPENLGDWPRGKAMYLSFGGAEGEQGYEEGPARQMGPSSLRHHADGSVEVRGEMVENPDEYKSDQTVGEEAEDLGMDKGAKSEGDEDEDSDDSESSEGSEESEGSAEESEDSADSGDRRDESDDSEEESGESDGEDAQSESSSETESEGSSDSDSQREDSSDADDQGDSGSEESEEQGEATERSS